MTPTERGRIIANAVLDAIAPRMAQGLGPVDVDALAKAIAAAIAAALADDMGPLFREEK